MRGMLNKLAADIRFHNGAQGFTVTHENVHEKLLLAVSEIVEAQEELRDGRFPNEFYYDPEGNGKPCGFGVEIADAIIRLLDIAYGFGIDIEHMIETKLQYNKTRPTKHGRQF